MKIETAKQKYGEKTVNYCIRENKAGNGAKTIGYSVNLTTNQVDAILNAVKK